MGPPFSPKTTTVRIPQTPPKQITSNPDTTTPKTTTTHSITSTATKRENSGSVGFGFHVLGSRGVSKRRYLAASNSINMKAVMALTGQSSPPPYAANTPNGSPYLPRINRFGQHRRLGVYERIQVEWIKKALLRQEKGLKWDEKTGEPLFVVGD
ncbi:hypothetical protein TWF694_005724 [Orbilia ellipsospora]|uniref:Uncharacterized protein n=1 Tax=Orbilia ellipsospora TaxID=2528407 RepID=A0AAV9WSX0_9PEZI